MLTKQQVSCFYREYNNNYKDLPYKGSEVMGESRGLTLYIIASACD